jgi:hypothetical protein
VAPWRVDGLDVGFGRAAQDTGDRGMSLSLAHFAFHVKRDIDHHVLWTLLVTLTAFALIAVIVLITVIRRRRDD